MLKRYLTDDKSDSEAKGKCSLETGKKLVREQVKDFEDRIISLDSAKLGSPEFNYGTIHATVNTLSRAIWVNYWKQTRAVTDPQWRELVEKRVRLYNTDVRFRSHFDKIVHGWVRSTEQLLTCPLGFTFEDLTATLNKKLVELDGLGIRTELWGFRLDEPLEFQELFFPIVEACRGLDPVRVPVRTIGGAHELLFIKSYCKNDPITILKNAIKKTKNKMSSRDKHLSAITAWHLYQIVFLNEKSTGTEFCSDIASIAQKVFENWLEKNHGLRGEVYSEYENTGCDLFSPIYENDKPAPPRSSSLPESTPQIEKVVSYHNPTKDTEPKEVKLEINEHHNERVGPLLKDLLFEKPIWADKKGNIFNYDTEDNRIRQQLSRQCDIDEACAWFKLDFP